MSRVTHYQPGPYDGVSEVAPQVALPSTCDEMVNCWPYIPHGVLPKPPLDWRKKVTLGDALDPTALCHEVPRGSATDDLLLVLNLEAGSVVPYLFNFSTLATVPVTVASTAAQDYLDAGSTGDVNQDLRAFSIEDVTFITNRNQVVANSASTASTRPFEGLIWVKTGGYSRTTSVTITPVTGSPVTIAYETDRGDNASDAEGVGTDRIAKGLYDGTIPASSDVVITGTTLDTLAASGFTVSLLGSIIYISHPTNDFTIAISDDAGGAAVVGFKDSTQRFIDLPGVAYDGFTIRIAQEAAGGNSDYYVQFTASGTTSTGTWAEVVQPGAPLGLDPETMPVKLYLSGTDWEIDVAEWGQRTTGNLTLSPDPDFIGDSIQKVGWWRGRLHLLANNSQYLSSSADPYAFYASSLVSALDSDPIALLPPADRKAFFKDAIEVNQRLITFADQAQAIADTAPGAVTPTSAQNRKLGSTGFNPKLPVQEAFSRAYYTAPSETGLVLFELALDRISGEIEPEDLSVAIPNKLSLYTDRAATYDKAYTTVYGVSGGTSLVVHTYRYSNAQRVQNSFYDWELPDGFELAGFLFRTARLYILLADADGDLCITSMDLAPLRTDPSPATVLQLLDLKVSSADLSAPVYDSVTDTTVYTLPYETPDVIATVRVATSDYWEGFTPEVLDVTTNEITLSGDWSAVGLWFGVTRAHYFTPKKWFTRGEDGNVRLDGRLTLTALRVDLAPLSYLEVSVSILGRGTRVTYFNANTLTSGPNLAQPGNLSVAQLRLPLGGQNLQTTVTFQNSSHFGFAVLGYEWDGDYNARSRRTT